MSAHLLTRESGRYRYRTVDKFEPKGNDYVLLISDTANSATIGTSSVTGRQDSRVGTNGDGYELVVRIHQNIGQARMPIMRPMVYRMRMRIIDGEIRYEVFHFFNLKCEVLNTTIASYLGQLFTGAKVCDILVGVYSAFRALSIVPLSQRAINELEFS